MGVGNGGAPVQERPRTPDRKRGGLRFHVRELGPVKRAELELGGLTVLAGRNNTGKTWLATALYGFLTRWREHTDAVFREFSDNQALAEAGSFLRHAAEHDYAARAWSGWSLQEERQILLDALSAGYSRGALDAVFGAPRGTFSGASVRVELGPPTKRLLTKGLPLGDGTQFVISQGDDGISVERTEDIRIEDADASSEDGESPRGHRQSRNLLPGLMRLYTEFALPEINFWVHPLPAEAPAVVLFQRELDRNKNRIVETLQQPSVAEPESALEAFLRQRTSRTSLLIRDFIDLVREMPIAKDYANPILQQGISKMMHGRYESDGHSIYFRSEEETADPFRIPLDLASASARLLAGLNYVETEGGLHEDLLLVDEPESVLDTANQIQLARVLARLVRRGTRILVVTHSDYLIKEFNNLVMLSQDFEDKKTVMDVLGYAPSEFLEEHEVCAFVAENGCLTRCDVDVHGMNMPVFDETIDSINSAANLLTSRVAG